MKSNALNGFNTIARVYDLSALLVFGSSLRNAQRQFLGHIPKRAQVLIIGGGTGWLLAELFMSHANCKIYYVEASSKMIELARKKVKNSPQVFFIHGTEESIPTEECFDVVITNFYLDLFSKGSLQQVIKKIKSTIAPQGIWLIADFVDKGKFWQRLLLAIMYRFFRVMSRIEATTLPQWQLELEQQNIGFSVGRFFYSDFIQSSVHICKKN